MNTLDKKRTKRNLIIFIVSVLGLALPAAARPGCAAGVYPGSHQAEKIALLLSG